MRVRGRAVNSVQQLAGSRCILQPNPVAVLIHAPASDRVTPFDYLSVLISIVLGLGLTELLSNVHRLVQARDRVTFHWLPVLWGVLVFVMLVQWWWAAFGLHQQLEWNFFFFLLILLIPVLMYLAAASVLPTVESEQTVDLRAYYFSIHHWFFWIVATTSLLECLRAVLYADLQAALFNAVGAALLGSLAIVRRPFYHAMTTILLAVLFVVFIVLETLRLV